MSYISNIKDCLFFLSALKKHVANCKKDFNFWKSSCQKDNQGRCVSFSSNLLNLKQFKNIELVIWNHHTNHYFHNKFIYLDRSKIYKDNVPEEDREYTLLVGPLDLSDNNPEDLNRKMIDGLYNGLFHGDFAYMIFHEITHLNNAKSISTAELSRLHHNYLTYARTKQSVERFPQIAFSLGIIANYCGKDRSFFLRDYPTADSFVNAIIPPEKEFNPESPYKDPISLIEKRCQSIFYHKKNKNTNSTISKLSTVWGFVASGNLEG